MNFAFLHAQVAGIWFLFLLGLALNVAVIAVILLALYAQKAMRRLCGGCLRLLARLRVVRRPEAAQEKLDAWLASFHDCAGFMRAHPWPVVKSFCIVLFQRVLYLLIPWCVYEAMGLSGVTVWQMMGLQLLLSVSVEMMPLPGAVGISESVSLVLYDAIFGAHFRYRAVILTRGISYYLPLLVSGVVTLGTRVSQLRAGHGARMTPAPLRAEELRPRAGLASASSSACSRRETYSQTRASTAARQSSTPSRRAMAVSS